MECKSKGVSPEMVLAEESPQSPRSPDIRTTSSVVSELISSYESGRDSSGHITAMPDSVITDNAVVTGGVTRQGAVGNSPDVASKAGPVPCIHAVVNKTEEKGMESMADEGQGEGVELQAYP